MFTKEELQQQINVLSQMTGMDTKVTELKAELARRFPSNEDKQITPAGDTIDLDVTAEEMEKAGSKFATAGLHASEFQRPFWETQGISISFPFVIVTGPDQGIESKISAGVSKSAVWKIKEILKALGVSWTENKATGKVSFNPDDVAGKKAFTKWETMKDTRDAALGGKGTEYTKPTGAIKIE